VAGRVGVNENRTVRVGTIVDGRISRVLRNVGDRVKKGEQLALLTSPEVDDTRAQYAKAHTEREHCRAELVYREHLRDRAKRLYDLKAGSLVELQAAEAEVHQYEIEVKIAQTEVGRLEERLEHLGITADGALEEYTEEHGVKSEDYEELESVPVVAPGEGTILERNVSPGTVVSSMDDLFVISDLTTLWVHAEVPETYLAALDVGQKASVVVEAYPGKIFSSRLAYIGHMLNPATRTIQVRCETGNAGLLLRPEMYATVSFELGAEAEAVFVPRESIQNVDGKSVVFVQEGDSEFRMREVQLGRTSESRVIVEAGLLVGEKVATQGSFLLKSEMLKGQLAAE
jgi:cobalt-zinc-cadmium efflux system membrane fusion protein